MSFTYLAVHALALAVLASVSLPLAAQTQTPFTGMPFALPGIIEAENFDNGGEGIAYHDNVPGNAGGQYRTSDSVDIKATNDPGSFVVTNFETGEWLEYTVDIAAAGQYEIALRVSSGTFTGAFHVEIDGANVTGRVVVPPTGSFDTFQWVAKGGVSLPAGQHVLRLVSEQQYFDVNQIRVIATPSTPFAGVITLPGTIEAENFDNGGEGIAYHDNVAGNAGGQYRTTESVDIKGTSDPGAFVVTNFETGEWLVYTVSVEASGLYDIELRASSGTFTGSAFHIEIDGANVTGTVNVPTTGSFDTFVWAGKKSVTLTAGQHILKLVSEQQYFDVNQIRVTKVLHTPFTGTPIQVPGTFEAEDFDLGGEGFAYHDNVAGNAGGQYRTTESVDIKATADPGAYVVTNFETGEWLVYTIDVNQGGNYDIELRASNGMPATSAFHLEIDGTALAGGSVAVPITGSFDSFVWIGKKNVALTAGQHVLKVQVDQQYFDLNQIRIVASAPSRPKPQSLLFHSGYEGATVLGPVERCGGPDGTGSPTSTRCLQEIRGVDSTTGFQWPPSIFGGSVRHLEMRPDSPNGTFAATIGEHMFSEIQPNAGRNGSRALFSKILKNGAGNTNPQGGGSTQMPYMLMPATGVDVPELYMSHWIKLQSDFVENLRAGDPRRVVFEWKSAGDFRIILSVVDFSRTNPVWQLIADNNANRDPLVPCYWRYRNTVVPVPVNQWFKLEVFWRRSTGADSRVWMAINGNVIFNRVGERTIGRTNEPVNRIMPHTLYSGTPYPIYQWIDDMQIWSTFPITDPQDPGNNAREGDPWFDSPYAPHASTTPVPSTASIPCD